MPMSNRGLSKLIEEAGEVIQVAGKLLAYPEGEHPDGGPPLRERLNDELADLAAAIALVRCKWELNSDHYCHRTTEKFYTFVTWDKEPTS